MISSELSNRSLLHCIIKLVIESDFDLDIDYVCSYKIVSFQKCKISIDYIISYKKVEIVHSMMANTMDHTLLPRMWWCGSNK